MKLPENYTLFIKNVKNVGIRVGHDQRVRIVAPAWLPEQHLELILRTKERWIQNHLRRFRERKQPVQLTEDQILFKGKIFRVEHLPVPSSSIIIDEYHIVIRTGNSLMEKQRLLEWYRNEARKYIERRVHEFAERHGYQYRKIYIRSQKTRWGSCSRRKNLSFNWKLMKTPVFVIDYLIMHELVHTEHLNHSKQYWQELHARYPDHSVATQWLKDHGSNL